MTFDLPNLQILPIRSLAVHEWHDEQRTPALIERLRASGVLRNPPVVSPLQDGSGKFMVLDGANRTAALRQMGLPHILAQVVEPNSPSLELKTWNHVLWGLASNSLVEGLHEIPDVRFKQTLQSEDLTKLWNSNGAAWVQTPDGAALAGEMAAKNTEGKVQILNAIVDSYKDRAMMDRTQAIRVGEMNGVYEDLCALIVFPPFEMSELLDLCSKGILLPTGITRFAIAPRALRVNYPLDDLAAEKSLEEKNRTLDRWEQEKIARKGVRFYSEATVLYDE